MNLLQRETFYWAYIIFENSFPWKKYQQYGIPKSGNREFSTSTNAVDVATVISRSIKIRFTLGYRPSFSVERIEN